MNQRQRDEGNHSEAAYRDIVGVEWSDNGWGWEAYCNECDTLVAIKATESDAHLLAAMHLQRVHSGL